ncbi:hypothetical protein ACEPAH_1816 [Sanghuangporus vaninii]
MDLSNTFGVVYWGFIIATALFGISVVQGYFFFLGNKDSWKLRLFVGDSLPWAYKLLPLISIDQVALMLLLDLSTTALSSEALHYYLVVNFGNPLALLYMTKPYVAEYAITLIIIFLSQTFYMWQIYTVNRTVWIPLLITKIFLATCSLGGGIALTVELFKVDLLMGNLSDSTIMICLSLATSFTAACDIVSTAAMCYYLAFRRSAYKERNTLLKTLLFLAVNRGVLATVAQIGHLALFVAFPSRAYWMPFHLSLSKLHVNTLLAMLNSRTTLRARNNATRLEISTNFASIGEDSPNSPSPRTPCSKRQSGGVGTFELLDFPRDMRRPSVIFSNMRKPPPGIEEEIECIDVEEAVLGKPISVLHTGEGEPITFA